MSFTNMLERAIHVSSTAHIGQKDKVGEPYIFHPLRVMMSLQGDIIRTVAVLHDVLEDTSTTELDLRAQFPDVVVDAVVALSRGKDESYEDYLNRVLSNFIAVQVKIADVKDNASPSRLYKLDPDTIQRLTAKYAKTLKLLEGY